MRIASSSKGCLFTKVFPSVDLFSHVRFQFRIHGHLEALLFRLSSAFLGLLVGVHRSVYTVFCAHAYLLADRAFATSS